MMKDKRKIRELPSNQVASLEPMGVPTFFFGSSDGKSGQALVGHLLAISGKSYRDCGRRGLARLDMESPKKMPKTFGPSAVLSCLMVFGCFVDHRSCKNV